MDAAQIIDRLRPTPGVVAALASTLPPEDARFKPPTGAWSILEIVNHLADEDRDDFRFRLKALLDGEPWPPNNPEQWAVERKYNEQDLAESLDRFARERAESLRWLKSLNVPDWHVSYPHPRVGPVPAGDLLISWPAHDALHIRQIAKRLFELAAREGAPDGFNTKYAGEWGA